MIEKGRSKIQIILVSRVITIWTFSGWAALAAAFSFVAQPDRINSCPAFKNKRLSVKLKIMSKNPAYFKRSYRLDRVDFMDLLSNIRPCIEYNELTNAVISVSLLIHSFSLRMLAGGSYLDICFGCRISTSHIYQIFWRVLEAINAVVDNIHFNYESDESMEHLESIFANISKGAFRGTVAAVHETA